MDAKVFRTLNIAIVGHVDHGKTTLYSAISFVIARKFELSEGLDYYKVKRNEEERKREVTIVTSTNEMLVRDNDKNLIRLVMIDCPGHRDYIKNLISGTAHIDYCILTVSAPKGCEPQTFAHLELIKPIYLAMPFEQRKLIVAITQTDQAKDLVEIIKMDVEITLEKYMEEGVFSEVVVIDCCAAQVTGVVAATAEEKKEEEANVFSIVDTLVNKFPAPLRPIDKPFKMEIEKPALVSGIGTVLVGTVISGSVKPGDQLELYFLKKNRKIPFIVTSIQAFKKNLDFAIAGESVGIVGRGAFTRDEVDRGSMLAKPNSLSLSRGVVGQAYIHSVPGKGSDSFIKTGSELSVIVGTNHYTCTLYFLKGTPEQNKRCVELIKKGAKYKHAADAESTELQSIINAVNFKGASKDESHDVLLMLADSTTKLPFEIGARVVGQESNINRLTVRIGEVLE